MVTPAPGATLDPMFHAMVLLGLPDLDRLRELLKRIQEILTLGGIASEQTWT